MEMKPWTSNISSDQNQASFFLPAVSSVAPPPPCPSVHTTAPVTHLDVLSTLKQHQLKGRTNQSVTGEHIGITIERSPEDANICYAFLMFLAATPLGSVASPQRTFDSKQEEKWEHFRTPFYLHVLRAEPRSSLL